jgi:hypothetical protein
MQKLAAVGRTIVLNLCHFLESPGELLKTPVVRLSPALLNQSVWGLGIHGY